VLGIWQVKEIFTIISIYIHLIRHNIIDIHKNQ